MSILCTYAWWPVSKMIGSCGESNTRCNASVSSTTPRLGPRCPPVAATLWIRNCANLDGQITQVRLGKVLQIGGPTDLFKHPASVRRQC